MSDSGLSTRRFLLPPPQWMEGGASGPGHSAGMERMESLSVGRKKFATALIPRLKMAELHVPEKGRCLRIVCPPGLTQQRTQTVFFRVDGQRGLNHQLAALVASQQRQEHVQTQSLLTPRGVKEKLVRPALVLEEAVLVPVTESSSQPTIRQTIQIKTSSLSPWKFLKGQPSSSHSRTSPWSRMQAVAMTMSKFLTQMGPAYWQDCVEILFLRK